uniref:RING-type E3 ubiquitin transferase n=1 Tax=Ditylenchus dipsaci TaxID=166011 RepID=A0A915E719_9BILA
MNSENNISSEFGDNPPSSSAIAPVNQQPSSSNIRSSGLSKQILCRYFASNMCYRGDSCSFSHDRNAKADMVCKYYSLGNCSYGQACRYDHIRPKAPVSASHSSAPSAVVSSDPPPVLLQRNSDANRVNSAVLPVNNHRKASSRFCNLPCIDSVAPSANVKRNESKEKAGNARQGVYLVPNNVVSASPPACPVVNAWARPLQSSNNFCMASMGYDLQGIEGNSFTPLATSEDQAVYPQIPYEDIPLCPYHESGFCIDGDECIFVHGNLCEMCGLNVLHPYNESKCKEHHRECLAEHEKAMEEAFAEAREEVALWDLAELQALFCLNCIREWRRRSETFETKTVRSCPECRVLSDFIIPSESWVEEQTEKDKVINLYRENMKQKQCKYIKAGQVDDCPFGNKCFYKHQLPDGTVVRGNRRKLCADSDDEIIMTEVIHSLMVSMGGSSRDGRSNDRNSRGHRPH